MSDLISIELTKKLLKNAECGHFVPNLTNEIIEEIIEYYSNDPTANDPDNHLITGLPYCGACLKQEGFSRIHMGRHGNWVQCFCDKLCEAAAHGG